MQAAAQFPDDLPELVGVFLDDPACLFRARKLALFFTTRVLTGGGFMPQRSPHDHRLY
jgi:hypothetical protein